MDSKLSQVVPINAAMAAFPDGRLAWPIRDFCKAVNISRSQWYELARVGRAPRTIIIGRRPMVTPEAVATWMRLRDEFTADNKSASLAGVRYLPMLQQFLANKTQTTLPEILEQALGIAPERWSRELETRVGHAMHDLGWIKRDRGSSAVPRKIYVQRQMADKAA